MTTRQRNLAFLLATGVLGAVGAYLAGSPSSKPHAFDAVPESAFLAITIDLGRVRGSDVLSELGFVRKSGLDEVSAQCGFDPIDRAQEAAIAVPENGEPGDFGLAVIVDVPGEDIVQCATKVLSARGGNATVHEEDGYTVVEDTTLGSSRPRLAMRPGAPLFIGHGPWLREMMRAFDRQAPRASASGTAHTRLRQEIHAEGQAIAATAILPVSVRNKLRDEVLAGQKAAGPTFDAVLAVSEVAVGVRMGDAGKEGLDAVARCETPEACTTLRDFLDKKRGVLSHDLAVRLIGLAALLDRTTLEARGNELFLSLDSPADEVARVVNRALTARSEDLPRSRPASDAGLEVLVIPARDH